ncbi:hypothetical protein [Cereibacter sediminicola]|uniref:hypothetical protein n=1 Tax=Cereibacter sediminicola TaxID=2584941 RepID=UPI00119CBE71|nr:hypothetical protein [Cereibacter sediminicola]
MRIYISALAASLGFLFLMGVLQADRPLWQDESLLLTNLGQDWWHYFSALPYHDQAAPPFTLILLDMLWRVTGGDLPLMRLALLMTTSACLAAVGAYAARGGSAGVVLAVAIVALSPTTLRYATEIKHYIFELLAALVLVSTAISLRLRGRTEPFVYAALALLLSFFSFSAMLVAVVVLADVVLFRVKNVERRRWVIALGLFAVVWGLLYLGIFLPITHLQLSNYTDTYQGSLLLELLQNRPGSVGRRILYVAGQPIFAILGAAILLIGLVLLNRAKPSALAQHAFAALRAAHGAPVRIWLGLTALILILSLLGLYPLSSSRQLLFTMAPSAIALASLFVGVLGQSRNTGRLAAALALVLLPGAAMEFKKTVSGDYIFQDTTALYKFLRSNSDVTVIPNLLFEPTLRLFVGQDGASRLRIVGLLSPASGPMESTDEVVARLKDTDASLPAHIWHALRRDGAYRVYADWIVSLAAREGEAHFAVAQLSEGTDRYIADSAAVSGCAIVRAFSAADVVAYRITCRQTAAP